MLEIEHKFLLKPGDDSWRAQATRRVEVVQGYLAVGAATVRVRLQSNKPDGVLCIKGEGTGLARPEFEYAIPADEARAMLEGLCGGRTVAKTRHYVPAAEKNLVWEIDEYHGPFEGHFTAELEVPSADTPFSRPSWLGREVSDDLRYRNAALAEAQAWPDA